MINSTQTVWLSVDQTPYIHIATTGYTDKEFFADLNKAGKELDEMGRQAVQEHNDGKTRRFPCEHDDLKSRR